MKRSREEYLTGVPSKRPANIRAENSAPVHATGISQPQATDNAFLYLRSVKDTFKDQQAKYSEFLDVMKDFKSQRIDTAGVITRVKDLFKGHRDLILGFNTFLPTGYEITLPPEEEHSRKPVEFDQARNYVNKIKTRFQHDEQVYKAFLEILYKYRRGNKTISQVYQEVASLFREHQDLLQEFTNFLPDHGDGTGPSPKVSGNSMSHRDDKKGRMVGALSDHDRHSSKRSEQDHTEHVGRTDKEPRKKVDKERERENRDNREKNGRHIEDMELERDFGSQQISSKCRSALKADDFAHTKCEVGGGGFMQHSVPVLSMEEKKAPKFLQKRFSFFDKVKSRLRSHDSYQEFLKCLNLYNKEIISRVDLYKLVNDLLGKYPDLVEGFDEFLTYCESREGLFADVCKKKFVDGPVLNVKVDKDQEENKARERERAKDGGQEKDRDQDKAASGNSREPPHHKASLLTSKEKFMSKPISELDLSNCESCTPSYRLLPKNYPRPKVSHRSKLAHSVLNDVWVSVTSGSEDYSFKHMRKNQYEESLFRCEDDRFELDMLIESTAVTIKRLEEMMEMIQQNGKQQKQLHLEECLTALHIRCIERIYGDHGFEVVSSLRKHLPLVLPIILSRLKGKQEEWLRFRMDMNKVWKDIYVKNYHKSLDHSRQQDKRSLSSKALLAEIKELNERERKDYDAVLSTVVGSGRPSIPELKFEYRDTSLHDDLYRFVKYSADEIYGSSEQSDIIMQLWTDFIEPFFGVPSRPHNPDENEEVLKASTSSSKENGPSNGDSDGSAASRGTIANKQVTSNMKMNQGVCEVHQDDAMTASPVVELEGINRCAAAIPTSTSSEAGPRDSLRSGGTTSRPGHGSPDRAFPILEIEGAIYSRVGRGNEVSNLTLDTAEKIEREEGELSPSIELDQRQMYRSGDNLTSIMGKKTGYVSESGMRNRVLDNSAEAEAECEHDADADDEGEESAQKASEDSENVSEPGEEVSAMESGDGKDSPRDHEEDDDEDEERGKKNESQCDAREVPDRHEGKPEGSSLASLDRSVMSCRPISVYCPSIAPNSTSNAKCSVFYGNDTLYVLFRLHQTLYERLLSAKTHANALEQKLKPSQVSAFPDLYERFMQALENLLDGSTDNAKFEDECRELLGTQSYALLTLDKLIFKLVKQLQAVASDEIANKLIALYSYERSRFSTKDFLEGFYHANTCTITHDENIYRLEHLLDSNQLSIQLMEGGSEKLEVAGSAIDSRFLKYLNSFLLAVKDLKGRPPVFLLRKKIRFSQGDDDAALVKAMSNVHVANGLEYKISCNNSKVSYVLDTEDFLHRRKRRKNCLDNTAKINKFHRWTDGILSCSEDRVSIASF